LPAANAMDVMNSNGTDAVNSKESAGENECPDENCWAKYEGKWKTQLHGRNVNNKVNGQNALYNGSDGTCGVTFCFFLQYQSFLIFQILFKFFLNPFYLFFADLGWHQIQ
jgi:hypothetical protein